MYSGYLDIPWWGLVLITLVMTHYTCLAVTVFLHRSQAHRSVELHPIVSHFFRFWLWMTTGMVTKEWVAVHRKHHAVCETEDDPHSPRIYGVWRVLLGGVGLYRNEAIKSETIKTFGRGTPDDWIERHIYSPYNWLGVVLMAAIDIFLFGAASGILIWGIQMLWIPFWAAGVINGIGHYFGYRNFATSDDSTNIIPWGIIIAGEELHNNHHAYASSARLSNKWFEFDIGFVYIRLFEILGLAKARKLSPKIKFDWNKTRCDMDTLRAVVHNRLDVMAYYRKALKKAYAEEIQRLKDIANDSSQEQLLKLKAIRKWITRDPAQLQSNQLRAIEEGLAENKVLTTIYRMKTSLVALWDSASGSQEQRVQQLQTWCERAEASGIEALKSFSKRLRCYATA
ncbi:MAG: fatty acid desaturase [Deltaproteobacteria bacterium]|nr:fatty acid desaturase [Deltaproteobacteria bacterium]